jgi:hypothetical protein
VTEPELTRTELMKSSCDFSFRGFPDPDDPEPDPDPPRPARPQTVWIDLERHPDYLESP